MISLPDDIWIEILSHLNSIQDIHSAVTSMRSILNTFNAHSSYIISTKVRRKHAIASARDAHLHALTLPPRAKISAVDVAVTIWQALEPHKGLDTGKHAWALDMAALYERQGATEKRRALLDSVARDILGRSDSPSKASAHPSGPTYLCRVSQRVLLLAAKSQPLPQRLLIEKQMLQRLSTQDRAFLVWSRRVMDTLVAMDDSEQAIELGLQMYESCRHSGDYSSARAWAKLLTSAYNSAGHQHEALEWQKQVLTHISRPSKAHDRWFRALIRAYVKADRQQDAVALETEEWSQVPVGSNFFRRYAERLARLHRTIGQPASAVEVMRSMYEQTESYTSQADSLASRQLLVRAARALAKAYSSAGMLDEASATEAKRKQLLQGLAYKWTFRRQGTVTTLVLPLREADLSSGRLR